MGASKCQCKACWEGGAARVTGCPWDAELEVGAIKKGCESWDHCPNGNQNLAPGVGGIGSLDYTAVSALTYKRRAG